MIKLGSRVKDLVTGFVGIAVARCDYLNGCIRIGVQPKVDKDGKLPDTIYFDEPQLKTLKENVVPVGSKETGGPCPYPPHKFRDPK